ncbi:hypothetical protein U1Q18_046781, partial [Sarracenia purpurea var. burkii]
MVFSFLFPWLPGGHCGGMQLVFCNFGPVLVLAAFYARLDIDVKGPSAYCFSMIGIMMSKIRILLS